MQDPLSQSLPTPPRAEAEEMKRAAAPSPMASSDFIEIEKRLAADMTGTFGVPANLTYNGGTRTGRFDGASPDESNPLCPAPYASET